MTEPYNTLSAPLVGDTETSVVVRTALAAAAPLKLEEDTSYAFRTLDGDVQVIDGPQPKFTPERKTGTVKVYDADSFGAYWHKHAQGDMAEIYADPYGPAIVGLLNGNGPETGSTVELGWGDHRLSLIFRHTPAWTRWTKLNGQLIGQVQFAQHLEDSLPDIRDPDGATMLELAQTFQAHTKVNFESGIDLGSGQRQLTYREEVTSGAGAKGNIVIPKTFTIAIAPFEGSPLYPIEARLRYRIGDGNLSLGFALDRPEDVLRTAFDDVLARVQEATGRVALLGLPPQ